MAARRSLELGPVPEDDRFSSAPASSQRGAESLARGGGRGEAGRDGGGTTSSLSHAPSRLLRRPSARQPLGSQGTLGRTSLVVRLQQQGRQLIDMGRLQASWISNTLVKRPEEHDYVNEEDQGFMALLARHVDIPQVEWERLHVELGGGDGQFWQTAYHGTGDFLRGSMRASMQRMDEQEGEEQQAAEEGKGLEPLERKPRRSIFGLPVIHPYNLFAVLWTMCILLLDLIYTAFWVPMNVAFCTAQYGNISSGCTTSDLVGGVLYFLNVLLGFQIGVVATNGFRKRTVVDGRKVTWLYVRYGRFGLDLLASLPFTYLVVVLAGSSSFSLDKGWINCLSLLRLLRMVRLVSISKVVYMDSLSGRLQETDSRLGKLMSVSVLYSVFLAYQLAVAINLFACIMILCAYFEGYDNSWMTSVDWAQLPTASKVYQWYCAVYWMIVTATTTGFGDFAPRNVAEQVVANVVMMGGMIMFGVLVASIGNALSKAASEALQAYSSRQKILHVMDWAEHRALPPDIRKQVQDFYADKYGRKEEETVDSKVMEELPSRLRAKVAKAMSQPLLAEVHVLQDLQDNVLELLAENMKPTRLPAGEDLCQQGDEAQCLWVLQEGTVQAVRYKEGSLTIDASEFPRLLGESVLLGDFVEACRVRPWTLRTVTPCRLWGIMMSELYPLMRMYPVIGRIAAEYVKFKALSLFKGASHDEHWCELAAVLVKQMKDRPPEEAEEMLQELSRASAFDGTLQPLLEHFLTSFAARRAGGPPEAASDRNHRGPMSGGGGSGGHQNGAVSAGQHEHPSTAGASTAPQPAGQPATSNTVFGTPAAAAALTSALQADGSGGTDATGNLMTEAAMASMNAYGHGGAGAHSNWQLASAHPGATGSAVQCPGCQRCVCPSCGQGLDPVLSPAGSHAAAPLSSTAAALLHAGVHTKPTAGPAIRAWVNRIGTLRRVSIGARQDQVWASERRSFDRRQLGAVSLVPYE